MNDFLVSISYSKRKVAKLWFDSWCASASLCPWERHLRPYSKSKLEL